MWVTILWCCVVAWVLFAWREAMHALFYLLMALIGFGAGVLAVMFWPVSLAVVSVGVAWYMLEHVKARRA